MHKVEKNQVFYVEKLQKKFHIFPFFSLFARLKKISVTVF